jgi:acyl-CoA synthetase (AMP-forming)/AMP-acid ligase II
MRLRRGKDVICCPPPLYHAFGLVLGLLACYTHGVAIVFPSWDFEPAAVLRAVIDEKCTGLLGVPTMLFAALQQYRQEKKVLGPIQLRTGIAAGSPVPRHLMEELQKAFGLPELVIIYGKLLSILSIQSQQQLILGFSFRRDDGAFWSELHHICRRRHGREAV